MPVHHATITISTAGAGTYEITEAVSAAIRHTECANGIVTVFCQHTSCSLVIFENADPSARADLENWLDRAVPANYPHFTHTAEGADDMPSHIKMALTRTSETVPFADGRPLLGTWQGIFLWEHRTAPQRRSLVLTVMGE